jgi:hypothetical protein
MMRKKNDFAAFILTHGRPEKVITYVTLRACGYTGPIYLLVDDLDKTKDAYRSRYGNEVVVFDKQAIAATFDEGDNFQDMRAVIYARNACFDVARKLGIRYFIQLDDDYRDFAFRFDGQLDYYPPTKMIKDLDVVFEALLEFFIQSGAHSVAFAQGGDFIGGAEATTAKKVMLKRKCMNSFVCSTDRPFQFVGRINEDVNTYTRLGSVGVLMLTANQVALVQTLTQTNSGGMTELYLDSGTYVKSFYSVMYMPSAVRIQVMPGSEARLHHRIRWNNTVPKILHAAWKKEI